MTIAIASGFIGFVVMGLIVFLVESIRDRCRICKAPIMPGDVYCRKCGEIV